jgi:peptidoglycan/LPS O-acetylase OafA/YrhL
MVRAVGVGSYSIYLWQESALLLGGSLLRALGLIAAMSTTSYVLIERPMLKLRQRVAAGHRSRLADMARTA